MKRHSSYPEKDMLFVDYIKQEYKIFNFQFQIGGTFCYAKWAIEMGKLDGIKTLRR